MPVESPAPVPPWPDMGSKAPSQRFEFTYRLLRQQEHQLLYKLWNGDWTEQDGASYRACRRAIRDGLHERVYNSGVYSAVSSDGGITWEEEGVECLPSVGVPHYIRMPDGTYKILGVDFGDDSIIESRGAAGRLVLAESKDGVHFTRDRSFRIVDIYVKHTIDPEIMMLPDGSLRIYYMVPLVRQVLEGRNFIVSDLNGCVLSAISKDGHTFYQEPGVRYTNPRQTTDPTYFQISEMKWAHYAHDFERMVIVGAISDDGGMSFEPIEGEYIFRTGSPVFARPVSGGFRMWFRDPDSPPASALGVIPEWVASALSPQTPSTGKGSRRSS